MGTDRRKGGYFCGWDDTIVLNATIGEITEWLFGVRTPKDIWREQKSDEIDRLNKIRTLKTIFFDEIV